MMKAKREAQKQGLNEIEPPENTGRKQDGRFRKGVTGNPNGRPVGARNRATRIALALLEGEAAALTRRAVELAMGGDVIALRFCLARLLPRCVERCIEFQLPVILQPKDAVAALSRITEGVGRGELTASEAHSLVGVVEAVLKAFEVCDLDQRISALEEYHAQP